MPVISDTPEFCFELARRFTVLQRLAVSPSPDARLLAFEGRQMCEHGLIRPGIMRMRRAIMMLRAEG